MTEVVHAVLFSALWISLCAVAFAVESCLVLESPWPGAGRLFFVFAATFCHYNLHYLLRTPDVIHSARDAWVDRHRLLMLIGAGISGCTACALLFTFKPVEIVVAAAAALLSALYSLPLLPRGWRLRDLGVLKPFVLAFVWAVVSVWLPAHDAEPHLLTLVILRRFVFMLALCLAFDVRDVERDRRHGVRTLPVYLGLPHSYRLIYALLVVFTLLAALVETEKRRSAVSIALIASAICTGLAFHAGRRWRGEAYYLGVVDGMMLLQAVLVAVAVGES